MISGKNSQSQLTYGTSWTKEEYEELLNEDLQDSEYIHKDIVFQPLHNYKNYEHAAPYLTSSTMVKFPGKDTLCMFGGIHMTSRKPTNEVWLYDIVKKVWERIRFNRKRERIVRLEKRVQYSSERANKIMNLTPSLRCVEPVPRCGHCAIALSSKDMLIFGGHDIKNRRLLNDCWILRVDNVKTWKLVVPEGRVPIPRWYASAVKYRDRVYVFGGETDKFKLLNDISVFNIVDERWLDVRTIYPTPSPRMLHSTAVVNGKMYVIGGLGKKNDIETCDIWEFDLTILKWKEIVPRNKMSPFRCYEDDGTNNDIPVVDFDSTDEDYSSDEESERGDRDFSQGYDDDDDEEEEEEEDVGIDFGFDQELEKYLRSERKGESESELSSVKKKMKMKKRKGEGEEAKSEAFASMMIRNREEIVKEKNVEKKSRKKKREKKKLRKIWKPIYGHCSVPCGNRIFIYGGKRNHKLLDEVWMFNLQTEKWCRYFPPSGDDAPPKFKVPNVDHPNVPPKRWKMMNSQDISIAQIFEVAETLPKFGKDMKRSQGMKKSASGKLRRKKGGKKKRGVKANKKRGTLGSVSSKDSDGDEDSENSGDPVLKELEKLEKFGEEHNIMPFLSDKVMTQRKISFFVYGGNLDPNDCGETICDLWKLSLTIKQKRHY